MNQPEDSVAGAKPAASGAAGTPSSDDSFDQKVKLASLTAQLATKLEVRKAILGAVLAIATAVALSFLSTQAAIRASKVVGGQYEVKLFEYADDGQPRVGADGRPVGRSEAIIPIDFGGAFSKPPKVLVAINGIDSWGGDRNVRVHAYAGNNATKDRSDIVVKTWGNSVVYVVQVSWIAFEDVDKSGK